MSIETRARGENIGEEAMVLCPAYSSGKRVHDDEPDEYAHDGDHIKKNQKQADFLAARKDGLAGSDVAIEASFVQHSIGKDDVALAIDDIALPGSEACWAGGGPFMAAK
jgi:phosphoribosylaminoimidazole (AIR) synthetase